MIKNRFEKNATYDVEASTLTYARALTIAERKRRMAHCAMAMMCGLPELAYTYDLAYSDADRERLNSAMEEIVTILATAQVKVEKPCTANLKLITTITPAKSRRKKRPALYAVI